ncbi:nuclear transport factor 2 family protein [Paenibacillus sp. GCM10027627]|uniref:nuclear transport factor 2 family protein n=1 Tax=unclassified Paenibacillus TaxID=185978 RepID=UPI0036259558
MSVNKRKEIVEKYIGAYNAFDVDGIVQLLQRDIRFRNYSGGEKNAETNGIDEFKQLAQRSAQLFSSRRQTITEYTETGDQVEVKIQYEAVLAADLSEQLKAGDRLQIAGKSVFEFDQGKIARIDDYS